MTQTTITDRFGRVWYKKWEGYPERDDTLYVHDQLAFPKHMISWLQLPREELRSNPNYNLCEICTQDWSKHLDATR